MDKSTSTKHNEINYEAFKLMALDENLSKYEKIGFPDNYRQGKEKNIFLDLSDKLKLDRNGLKVLDIGCGCSDLADFFIENAEKTNQELLMLDSAEMLSLLKDSKVVKKIPGQFPTIADDMSEYLGKLDVVVAYSVMQHVVLDFNPYSFIDKALDLLKPNGYLLLGDIPNNSKRNRYFCSEAGRKAHEEYVGSKDVPLPLRHYPDTYEKIDDGILFGILLRYRGLGMETYILPQGEELPMATRREDILIIKN